MITSSYLSLGASLLFLLPVALIVVFHHVSSYLQVNDLVLPLALRSSNSLESKQTSASMLHAAFRRYLSYGVWRSAKPIFKHSIALGCVASRILSEW